jgi:hypothetical protein
MTAFILADSGTRRQPAARSVLLVLAVLTVIIPLHSPVRHWLSNKAQAATGAAAIVRDLVAQDPDRLTGLHARDIELAFATPELKRLDGAMKMWQYRAHDCVLDIYFKDDTVSWYEMRAREKAVLRPGSRKDGPQQDNAGCMRDIMKDSAHG